MNFEQFVLGHDPATRLGGFTSIALGAALIGWRHIPNALRAPLEDLPLRLAEFKTRALHFGKPARRAKAWPVAIR